MGWQEVDRIVTEHVLARASNMLPEWMQQAAGVRRAGSFLTLSAQIVWRRYRLYEDTVSIGRSLQIKPATIRQTLYRMNENARALGLETFRRHISHNRVAERTAETVTELWKDPSIVRRRRLPTWTRRNP